jgi:hypothetical protein
MKYWLLILVMIVLTGCTKTALSQPEKSENSNQMDQTKDDVASIHPTVNLEDYGPAPELTNQVWLNVDQPLRLADLRGQVVLLEMWTFG